VVAAYPSLKGLYREEIYDGLEYAKLRALELRWPQGHLGRPPHELTAAYGGNGLGLCEHYLNASNCKEELDALGIDKVLSLIYSEEALSAVWAWKKSAYPFWLDQRNNEVNNLIDWDAGCGFLAWEGERDDWNRVRSMIKESLTDVNGHLVEVNTVLLLGESARRKEFKCVVSETLRELLRDMPRIYEFDPLFVAARGAAEFAWRIQEVILQSERNGSSIE
jgi:hypothetical protein